MEEKKIGEEVVQDNLEMVDPNYKPFPTNL